jgi:DNA (cytosine-5)-methyltransferase 1
MKRLRPSTTKPTLISLFSGAMGLDIGLEQSGFELRAAVENNPAARETIKLNRPDLPVLDDITIITTRQLLKAAGLRKRELTVLSGGPCCQSFSTVGKRHSLGDPRGNLFRDFCRIVREAQPRFFIMENVPGILSAAIQHRPLNQRGPGFPPLSRNELFGSALTEVIEEFKRLKYHVVFGVLNAADFGVPQKRHRVVFIGSRDGEPIRLPSPTHSEHPSAEHHLLPWMTLRVALKNVRSENWFDFSETRKKYLRKLKPGQNWRHLKDKRVQRNALGGAFLSWGGRTGFYRRLAWDQPSPTLTTQPNSFATMLCHPTKLRPLSVEEYSAIQQFPKKWKFAGSVRQRYELIGNAVPTGLGKHIGLMLKQALRARKSRRSRVRRIVCADTTLATRLMKRQLTRLNPGHMRRYPLPESARKWLRNSNAIKKKRRRAWLKAA